MSGAELNSKDFTLLTGYRSKKEFEAAQKIEPEIVWEYQKQPVNPAMWPVNPAMWTPAYKSVIVSPEWITPEQFSEISELKEIPAPDWSVNRAKIKFYLSLVFVLIAVIGFFVSR